MHQARCLRASEINQIICQASNLTERLAGSLTPVGNDPLAAKRLARWKFLVANNDESLFRNRLEADGLRDVSESQLLALLGEVECPADAVMPFWAALLQEITQSVSTAFLTGRSFCPHLPTAAIRSVPFAKLYLPIVALAQRKIEAAAPALTVHLSTQAWQGLLWHLLSRLSSVCSLALQPKFLAFKAVRQSGFAFPYSEAAPPARRQQCAGSYYGAFVQEQGAQGLCDFFVEYPAAARLAAQITQQWIAFVTEFLRRLDADESEIAAHFGGQEPLGRIATIKAGVSDPHRGGRSVLILQFENRLRLIYKPRPMQIDAAFFELLGWFNARSGLPALHRLAILEREGYGWESCVEHSPCASRGAAKRFYRRAGALLCLIHALRGTDFHCENLIAAADHPVAVDLEALCHPRLHGPSHPEEADPEQWRLETSVLRTGMLPIWERRFAEERFFNFSALGAPVHQRPASGGVCWKKINTDAMEAFWGTVRYTCATHRPRWQGKPLSASRYLDELTSGFRRATRLIAPGGRLAKEWQARIVGLKQLEARIIRRPTQVYLMLIRFSLQPYFLGAGIDRSIELQVLPRAQGGQAEHKAELAALEQLDVPYFSKMSGENHAAPSDGSFAEANDLPDFGMQAAIIEAASKGRITLEQGRIHRKERGRARNARSR